MVLVLGRTACRQDKSAGMLIFCVLLGVTVLASYTTEPVPPSVSS